MSSPLPIRNTRCAVTSPTLLPRITVEHQRVAGQDDRRQAGHVEQQHRAARIVHRHLREEREREQRHESDVPVGERAPQVRLEIEVMRQVVFAANDARQHEQAGRHEPDAGEAAQRLDLAIDHDVVEPADRDAEADDDHRVGEHARHADRVARERAPPARGLRRHQQRMRQNVMTRLCRSGTACGELEADAAKCVPAAARNFMLRVGLMTVGH